jgi:hypothetical protein
MSSQVEPAQSEGGRKRKRTVPLWLILLIAAALGIGLALLFPITNSPPM